VPIDGDLWTASALSAALLVVSFFVLWPPPRASIVIRTTLAIVIPIVLMSLYLIFAYRTWNWGVLGYGSAVPWVLAGLLSAVMLWRVLFRAPAPVLAKVVTGVLGCVSWLFLSVTAGLEIACRSGDCL
jgi:hypothetical protein